jgi:protein CpxP
MTDSPASTPPAPARRFFNRATVTAFVAGAALTAAIGASAYGIGVCQHGMMMGGMQSPADVTAHVDHALKHFYVEIEATDAQKAQIDPLVKQAVSDLMPLHAQMQTAHAQVLQALSQPTVDRAALETARTAHLQMADQASKRFVQLVADVSDVLTVPQRKAFTDHLQQMHGMGHGMPHS